MLVNACHLITIQAESVLEAEPVRSDEFELSFRNLSGARMRALAGLVEGFDQGSRRGVAGTWAETVWWNFGLFLGREGRVKLFVCERFDLNMTPDWPSLDAGLLPAEAMVQGN